MKMRYVLIDHENVQPKDLALLDGQPLRVIVFLGANQKRLSTDLATALQARDPSASFHVISKDGDYGPLLAHLRSKKIDAQCSATLASLLPAADETVEKAIAYLRTNRPRRKTTLENALNTHLGGKLGPHEIERVITELTRRGVIAVTDGKVAYP
jgi:hypothetical protein